MQGFKTHGFAGGELPAMLATFSSYEDMLGPCHPLTLRLLTEVGITLWQEQRIDEALIVLQRGLRDTTRALGRNHDLRLRLLAALRDLLTELGDYENAAAAQKELLERHAELFGAEHAETFAARETLARILLRSSPSGAGGRCII
jgi:tetratricopeptide (TPR) repeat protein